MLNFLYAQGGANSAGFGHHRVSLSLAPKPQEDEGGNHACSVKSSVPPARVQIPWEVDSDRRPGRVRLQTLTLETAMQVIADRPEAPSAIRTNLGAIFASLELSHSTWLITSLSQRRENVQARGARRRYRWAAAALCSTSRESCSADGPQLSDHRHS